MVSSGALLRHLSGVPSPFQHFLTQVPSRAPRRVSSGAPSLPCALSLTHCAAGSHRLWPPSSHLDLVPSPAHPSPLSPPPGAGDRCYLRPPDSSRGFYGAELLVRKSQSNARAALTWPACPRKVATMPATRQVPQVWEVVRGPCPLPPPPLNPHPRKPLWPATSQGLRRLGS